MEEYLHLCGAVRKPKRVIPGITSGFDLNKRKAALVRLPESFSIKEKFPPVYLQHYGNCTSAAALGADDMIYHNKKSWVPSATFTYYNQKKGEKPMEDTGSCVEYALKMIKKYGACNASIWSNDISPWYTKPSKLAYENGLKGKEISKWYLVKNLKQVKQALFKGYPVVVSMDWAFKSYDDDFILNSPTDKEIEDAESGHAMVIVGYDDAKKLIEIRNSWSEKWCNNGYGFIRYEDAKRVIWWDDTYAIVR